MESEVQNTQMKTTGITLEILHQAIAACEVKILRIPGNPIPYAIYITDGKEPGIYESSSVCELALILQILKEQMEGNKQDESTTPESA